MAVKSILEIGEESLREKSNLVDISNINTKDFQLLIEDLIDTHKHRQGIGIAAPQIGINLRFFLTELPIGPNRPENQSDDLRIYINPVVTYKSTEKITLYEGCLSIADGNFCLPIIRPRELIVEAYDRTGSKFRIHCDGILARVIQHEYDHLDGILFIDKDVDVHRAISNKHSRDFSTKNESIKNLRMITIKNFSLL